MRDPAPGGCHIWIGALDKVTHGYAQMGVDGRTVRAHRWIWEQERGPIKDGLTIEHTCGRTSCVNVDHLELVTHSENSRRGRAKQLAMSGACE